GLRDDHPGVRFAACLALGRLVDRESMEAVRPLADDPDVNVKIGAYFALERMGDHSLRRAWFEAMRDAEPPEVRRNAVMALAMLDDPRTKMMLKRVASEDS